MRHKLYLRPGPAIDCRYRPTNPGTYHAWLNRLSHRDRQG